MLRTNGGTRGGLIQRRVAAALSGLVLRSVGGMASREVPCRVSDAPGGSVRRVSGTLGGLVLRCVGGMLCAVLVASGCSDDGSNAVESVTTTIPPTTAAPITTSPATTAVPPTAVPPTAVPPTAVPPTTTATPITTAESTTTLSPPTTAPATTTGAPLSEEEEIFAAIARYYEVLVDANNPPDPASPLWEEVLVPARAELHRAKARQNLEQRLGARWAEDRQPHVRSPQIIVRQGSLAVVDLCVRNSDVVYDLDTNEIIDDSVGYYWRQVTATSSFGPWLVSQDQRVEQFDTEEACIASYQ